MYVPSRGEQLRIDVGRVSAAIVPGNVRIARSPGRLRITVIPVLNAGSTTIPLMSTPRSLSASHMNVPNTSSPTIPTNAVRRPSRAAPAAKIPPDPPIVSSAPSTTRST